MATSETERLREEVERLKAELDALRAEPRAPAEEGIEGALRESEATYRSLVAALSEGVVLQAADGAILTCNAAAEEILGLSRDQMMGRTSMDPRWRAVHLDGSEFTGDTHPSMVTLRTGEPQRNVPMGVHKPNGETTWISINTQPLFREGAERPHAVVASFTDVSEFRAIEQALERSARQLRVALASARAGVWEWEVGSEDVWWSDGVEALFGLGPGEFDGTFASYVALIDPVDRERVVAAIQRALEAPVEAGHFDIEHRISSPRSGPRWVYCSGAVLRGEDGRPLRMTGTIIDVHPMKELEQRLLHSQKMESVGRLAGGVAHDFNNLLTAILGFAEIGLYSLDDPDEVRASFTEIRAAAEQGSRLTRQLLSFARRQILTLTPVRVGEVVRGCAPMLSRLLGEHVVLELRHEDRRTVLADAGQLQQVIVNLAVNAGEAMPKGGVLRIEVDDVTLGEGEVGAGRGAASGPHVRLRVTDTGVGIPADVLSMVVEPFFTTKPDGSGLGLATCDGIVEQLGGWLTLRSEPARGTTVEVHLPSTSAQPAETVSKEAPRPRGAEHVMVVEDEERVRRLTVRALEHHGYTVIEAASPFEALEKIEKLDGSLDLVVSDVLMPGMSGVDFAERLRASQPDLPVLLVSGYTDEALLPAASDRPHHFLPKPYSGEQLARKIRDVLDGD